MARFRATIHGRRGEKSSLGDAKTGITARVNGWDAGIRVDAGVTPDGRDCFDVFWTGGSHARISEEFIGRLTADESGAVTWKGEHDRADQHTQYPRKAAS